MCKRFACLEKTGYHLCLHKRCGRENSDQSLGQGYRRPREVWPYQSWCSSHQQTAKRIAKLHVLWNRPFASRGLAPIQAIPDQCCDFRWVRAEKSVRSIKRKSLHAHICGIHWVPGTRPSCTCRTHLLVQHLVEVRWCCEKRPLPDNRDGQAIVETRIIAASVAHRGAPCQGQQESHLSAPSPSISRETRVGSCCLFKILGETCAVHPD